MKQKLFYFAITCWILSIFIHIASLLKFDITENIPFVWLLHLGIFIVWIPTIFDLRKDEEYQAFQQKGYFEKMNLVEQYKIMFKKVPTWFSFLILGISLYTILNFILFAISQPGSTDIKNGEYILHNHGTLIKTLTEKEYHEFKANEVRGFSGHWILFYGIAVGVLFKYRNKQEI